MKLKIIPALLTLFFLFILFMENSSFAQNWPMLNLNKERTSWALEENVLHPPLQIKTEYSIKSPDSKLGDISFFNNLLCLAVQNEPNTLEVFDIGSGDTLWTFKVPASRGSMSFTCAQNDSLIFAGGQQGLGLYALDRETGNQKWHKPIGTLYTKNIILDDDLAYILGDSLYCLNIKDGETAWTKNINLQGTPAVDDLFVYVVGLYKIQIFNKFDGTLLWERKNSNRTSGSIAVDDLSFYTISNDTVFAYNKETRDIKWIYPRPGDTLQVAAQNSISITDSKLCFTIRGNGQGNGQLVTLNKETGGFLWEQTFIGVFVFAPVIANGVVYVVPFAEAALYGYDLEDGEQLFYDNSAIYRNQPIVANHGLYAIATDKVIVFENIETYVNESSDLGPQKYELMQNYPNPFNPKTIINYELPITNDVDISIYNLIGQKMVTLVSERQPAGAYHVEWDASGFTSGVYFYQLQTTSGYVQTRKLMLIK
jgi:outer membrane protein assembly factor BamB